MKIIFLSISLLCTTFAFAQEKKASVKKTTAPQTSVGSCYADKKWSLSKVEKFGVEKDPSDEQKNDFLMLKGDNSFTLKYNGIDKFGTYVKSGAKLNLKMADGSETWPFKIISCDASILKVDYQDGDTHNNLTYSAK